MKIRSLAVVVCLAWVCQSSFAQLGTAPLPQLQQPAGANSPGLAEIGKWLHDKFEELGAFKAYEGYAKKGKYFKYQVDVFPESCRLRIVELEMPPAADGGFYIIALHRQTVALTEIDPDSYQASSFNTVGERDVSWWARDQRMPNGRSTDVAVLAANFPALYARSEASIPEGKLQKFEGVYNWSQQVSWVGMSFPDPEIKGRVITAIRDAVKICKTRTAVIQQTGTKKPGELY